MEIQISDIEIKDFIFHVVHHNEENPILLDDTPLGKYDFFFKERIKEVLEGNRFYFNPTSTFLNHIREIESDNKKFLAISKTLAQTFHAIQDDRIKPGVMILMKTLIGGQLRYILIKYDHENIIYYKTINKKAILDELSDTFSKSKDALQKSAIIHLDGDNSYAVIVDRSERNHITKFFKSYLGIKRHYTPDLLTNKVKDCYLAVVKEHRDVLPSTYTSQSQQHFYDLVQQQKDFNIDKFAEKIFGPYYTPEIRNSLEKELVRKDISGEEFLFDKNIKKPPQRKLRTKEGVSIQYSNTADDTVKIAYNKNNTVITITTKQLIEE